MKTNIQRDAKGRFAKVTSFLKKAIVATIVLGSATYGAYWYFTQESVVVYQAPKVEAYTVVEVSSDVEKARKQLEEATNRLDAEEAKILADTEVASSTAYAQVAAIMAEYETKKAENDAKLDEINDIRSSF